MKCEIIRDLLPSYIDGLTSDESNFEVGEHIKGCSKCKVALEEMKAEISAENIEINKEKIRPFKKMNKKVIKAVLITLALCILAVSIYLYLFAFGWSVNSRDLTTTYSYDDNTINIHFELTDGKALTAWSSHPGNVIKFRESFKSALDDRGEHPNQFSTGIHYKDETGKQRVFNDNECIILYYRDKTVTIYWKDVVKKLGIK